MLRTIARGLLFLDDVEPTDAYVMAQVPPLILASMPPQAQLFTPPLPSEAKASDVAGVVQAHTAIVAGVVVALSLRFAGSNDEAAARLVTRYVRYFCKLKSFVKSRGGSKADLFVIESAILSSALSLSIILGTTPPAILKIAAGSGDLDAFRLLRALALRPDANFGAHLAVSMALGFLFLAGGRATFRNDDKAVAALLMAIYPIFPSSVSDNHAHFQIFRWRLSPGV
jgi:anaphase-promoting complex subunit 1